MIRSRPLGVPPLAVGKVQNLVRQRWNQSSNYGIGTGAMPETLGSYTGSLVIAVVAGDINFTVTKSQVAYNLVASVAAASSAATVCAAIMAAVASKKETVGSLNAIDTIGAEVRLDCLLANVNVTIHANDVSASAGLTVDNATDTVIVSTCLADNVLACGGSGFEQFSLRFSSPTMSGWELTPLPVNYGQPGWRSPAMTIGHGYIETNADLQAALFDLNQSMQFEYGINDGNIYFDGNTFNLLVGGSARFMMCSVLSNSNYAALKALGLASLPAAFYPASPAGQIPDMQWICQADINGDQTPVLYNIAALQTILNPAPFDGTLTYVGSATWNVAVSEGDSAAAIANKINTSPGLSEQLVAYFDTNYAQWKVKPKNGQSACYAVPTALSDSLWMTFSGQFNTTVAGTNSYTSGGVSAGVLAFVMDGTVYEVTLTGGDINSLIADFAAQVPGQLVVTERTTVHWEYDSFIGAADGTLNFTVNVGAVDYPFSVPCYSTDSPFVLADRLTNAVNGNVHTAGKAVFGTLSGPFGFTIDSPDLSVVITIQANADSATIGLTVNDHTDNVIAAAPNGIPIVSSVTGHPWYSFAGNYVAGSFVQIEVWNTSVGDMSFATMFFPIVGIYQPPEAICIVDGQVLTTNWLGAPQYKAISDIDAPGFDAANMQVAIAKLASEIPTPTPGPITVTDDASMIAAIAAIAAVTLDPVSPIVVSVDGMIHASIGYTMPDRVDVKFVGANGVQVYGPDTSVPLSFVTDIIDVPTSPYVPLTHVLMTMKLAADIDYGMRTAAAAGDLFGTFGFIPDWAPPATPTPHEADFLATAFHVTNIDVDLRTITIEGWCPTACVVNLETLLVDNIAAVTLMRDGFYAVPGTISNAPLLKPGKYATATFDSIVLGTLPQAGEAAPTPQFQLGIETNIVLAGTLLSFGVPAQADSNASGTISAASASVNASTMNFMAFTVPAFSLFDVTVSGYGYMCACSPGWFTPVTFYGLRNSINIYSTSWSGYAQGVGSVMWQNGIVSIGGAAVSIGYGKMLIGAQNSVLRLDIGTVVQVLQATVYGGNNVALTDPAVGVPVDVYGSVVYQ